MAQLNIINAAVANLSAKVDDLTTRVGTGQLVTEADQQAVADSLNAIAAKVEGIGATPVPAAQ